MSLSSPCPCCTIQHVAISFATIMFITYYFLSFLRSRIMNKKSTLMHVLSSVLFGFWWLLAILVGVLVIGVGVLSTKPDLQQRVFSNICLKLTSQPLSGELTPMDQIRCDLVGQIEGRILEIGPGPGTNFRCWKNNSKITSWVGVEPNPYFKIMQEAERVKQNISFAIETVWLKGENIDIEPNSFDVVIGTHVLCSVDNVNQVIHQVYRALKPKGTYYFMEHILAPENTALYSYQAFFSPLFNIVGNGCQFKAFYEIFTINQPMSSLKYFDINIEKFNAPLPIPLAVPHMKGTAVKVL